MIDEKVKPSRAFDMSLQIDASPRDVWDALTRAEELVRWFPLEASVTPGEGGHVRWSWGDSWTWETRIETWEPGRRLRLVYPQQFFDADGRPLAGQAGEPSRIAIEFTLESDREHTTLRLVHSGFGHGADWDDEVDGIGVGWQSELRSLRHYLRFHRQRERRHGWARGSTSSPAAAVWSRLLRPDGFDFMGQPPVEGEPYAVNAVAVGERFTGSMQLHVAGREVLGSVRELDEGLFRIGVHRAGGRTGITLWLSTYSNDAGAVRRFEQRAQEYLDRLTT